MNQIITAPVIAEQPQSPVISSEGNRIKGELLAKSTAITAVASVPERDLAIKEASLIKRHIDDVEKSRKEIKEPFYRMGVAIDTAAKDHVAELSAELKRVNGLIGGFNEVLRLAAERERQEREREAKRIADEAARLEREAEQKAAALKAEQDALAAKQQKAREAAEAKGKELTPAQKAKQLQAELDAAAAAEEAEAELAKQRAELDARKAQAEQDRIAAAELARQQKASGGAQRTEYEIEVHDIKALYAAHPACVLMKPDLTHIKFLIRTYPGTAIPGVTYREVHQFATRKA